MTQPHDCRHAIVNKLDAEADFHLSLQQQSLSAKATVAIVYERRIDSDRRQTIKGMATMYRAMIAALLIAPISSHATIIVSGGSLEITGPVIEPVNIINGGTATLRDGNIVSSGQSLPRTGVVTLQQPSASQRNTFRMEGNSSVTSTLGAVPIMMHFGSTARLSDDARVVTSGDTAIQSYGGHRANIQLTLEDRATVVGNVRADGTISIADQARITGRLSEDNGNIALTMSGGAIEGGVSLTSAGDYSVNLSGGRIDNGLHFGSQTANTFAMSGGEIHGGLTTHGQFASATISGGSIFGGIGLNEYSPLSILGGSFNSSPGEWLVDIYNTYSGSTGARSILSIYGGQFGYEDAGNGIRLSGVGGLDIYGYGLTFVNGLLSGYLSDGNWLSLSVFTDSNWAGAVNLHEVARTSVPEPSTALLMLTALTGMLGARRFTSRPTRLVA